MSKVSSIPAGALALMVASLSPLSGQEPDSAPPESRERRVIQITPNDQVPTVRAIAPIGGGNVFFLNHRGQIGVAEALRRLMEGSAIRESHRTGDPRVQDPYCLRCQPQVMGAALDVLRQAAATLAIEANGVSDNPLIFAGEDEALSGGNFHAEPVAFAADMLAIATCEIGSLAERRIALLLDPSLSRLPAFLTSLPGLNWCRKSGCPS